MKENHESSSSSKKVNGELVSTEILEITNANILQVEVGTNGYQGGNSGNGGRTYFSIKNLGASDFKAKVEKDKYGCISAEILLGGDAELYTFIEALEFAVKTLKEQSQE